MKITKKATVTRVEYQLVEIIDGEPSLTKQPTAIFRGILSKERAKKLLAKRYGDEITIFISDIDTSTHRFSMDFEEFIRAAVIEDSPDSETDDMPASDEDVNYLGGDDPSECINITEE